MHDILVQDAAQGQESALITLDQSKAYYLVSHKILLDKLGLLGFQPQALEIMASFLDNRKQFVQVDGFRSQNLLVGPSSVVQCSVLSCALYLVFILDLPHLFHTETHTPEQYRQCKQVNVKTFIDDAYTKVNKQENKDLKQTILETLSKVEDYTRANQLSLNADKTKIVLMTKDKYYKEKFHVILDNKEVRHQKQATVLGNLLPENLTWEAHVSKNLVPALRNRIRTIRLHSH